jgi:hypothetical protein
MVSRLILGNFKVGVLDLTPQPPRAERGSQAVGMRALRGDLQVLEHIQRARAVVAGDAHGPGDIVSRSRTCGTGVSAS